MTSDHERIFVIPRRELPSLGRLFLLSAFWGFLVFLVAVLLELASSAPEIEIVITPELAIIAMVAVAIPWPIWRLRQRYRTIVTTPRAAWLGFGYALGIFGPPMGMVAALMATETSSSSFELRPFGIAALIMSGVIVIVTIAWLVIRLTLPKFVLQDGTRCPNCAHCVLGVQSMRCPECGTPFTYEGLETTEQEFVSRTSDDHTLNRGQP